MDRTATLWVLVLFLGASLLFRVLRRATADQGTLVTVGVQVGALAAVIAVVVLVVRRRGRGDGA
jgi:membrane protein DedA with SNARE-associated domain